jgi:uncharacterized protein (DUF885 family)
MPLTRRPRPEVHHRASPATRAPTSWRWAPLLATVLALAGVPAAAQQGTAASAVASADNAEATALHALFARHWQWSAEQSPEFATLRGDHRYGDRLVDVSPAAQAARDAQVRSFLAEARALRRDRLGSTDRVSLDMFILMQQRQVEQQAHPGYRAMTLRSGGGPQSQFADLLGASPMGSRERVEQSLARMAAFPKRMEQEIVNLRASVAAGWAPGRDVVQRVVTQLDTQLATELEASPYVTPFKRIASSVPAAERAELLERARVATRSQVLPAIQKLRDFVAAEVLPKAPVDGSLQRHPEGAKVYQMLVRQHTTTEQSAAEIHAVGQRELKRLRAEMEAVQAEMRFEGSFAQFVQHLNTDPKYYHASPEALLAGYREIAKRLDAEVPKLFAELPRAPYGVVAMPAYRGNAAEYYNGPAIDGSRAGFFFANTTEFKTRPKWAMETLTAHEAVPGHHLQIARSTELRGLPDFRRSGFGYTVFNEGWALYAETLGFDLGLYTEPSSRYGHLQWQAFRAARLVVDTGIHALGWSRQQAIDFMTERTGVNLGFVTSEVDRYTSNPGQALAYMVGKLKIDELRDRARSKLGPRFDIRRFHNAVIDNGSLPLPTLERLIDEWIAAQQGG